MTEEIINKDELKNLRFLLQNGQKLAISTKEFERVFDKIDSLEQENKQMKSALEEINILAKNYCNACDEFKAKTYKNKNDCLYCNYGFIKRKIN